MLGNKLNISRENASKINFCNIYNPRVNQDYPRAHIKNPFTNNQCNHQIHQSLNTFKNTTLLINTLIPQPSARITFHYQLQEPHELNADALIVMSGFSLFKKESW